MRLTNTIASIVYMFLAGTAQANECLHKLGNVEAMVFGSSEQVQLLQQRLLNDCPFIGIEVVRVIDSKRKQLVFLAYDVEAEKLFRLKMDLSGFRFESWRNLSRDDILSDDPSDGIYGGRFYAGRTNEDPSNKYLTQQIVDFYMAALEAGAAEVLR